MIEESERWRQRYTEALDRFRDDELRWRDVEDALRKLVTRLTKAAYGQNDTLNERLAEARSIVAREALEAAQLTAIEQRLATAMLRLDDTGVPPGSDVPVAGPAPQGTPDLGASPRLRTLLLDLVRRLPDDLVHSPDIESLSVKLRAADSLQEICDITVRLADQLALRVASLQKERERLQGMLATVSTQLRGIERFFADADGEREAARVSGEGLNRSVLAEVRQLSDSASAAKDLPSLQGEVRRRLSAIDDHLKEFREREDERQQGWEQRIAQQKSRIEELENEMQAVQHRLRVREAEVLTDALTAVANRQAYNERIKEELARNQRHPRPLCLAAIDIDHFKAINDNHGHQTGDKVLQTLARHMQRYLREQDFVARYGGEEFVVILAGMDLQHAFRAIEKLRKSVDRLTISSAGKPLAITISAGIAGQLSSDTPETLFERADKALYQAKNTGRNRCVAV